MNDRLKRMSVQKNIAVIVELLFNLCSLLNPTLSDYEVTQLLQ